MGQLTLQNQHFIEGVNTDFIGQSAPVAQVGEVRDQTHSGFFIYATADYTLWFKTAAGSWIQHQQVSSIDPTSRTFSWSDNIALYLQATDASQVFYITARDGALLIDNTPADGSDAVDTLVLSPATSLRVYGAGSTITQTETSHVISDASPVTIDTPNEGTIQVVEDTSDYADSLSSKLAAYYKFENNTDDSSAGAGSSLASASAGCVYVAGKSGMGQALHQTSNTAHVALNNPDLVNLGADHTIAAWIYVPSAQTVSGNPNPFGDIWVFSNVDSTVEWGPLKGVHLGVNHPGYGSGWGMSTNSVKMLSGVGQGQGIYDFAWYVKGTPQDSFPFDEWVHIAYTIHSSDQAAWGSNIKLFINGQLQSTVERTDQPNQNAMLWSEDTDVVMLGGAWEKNRPGMVPYYSGELMYDEIAIWKRELSEVEIADLYNGGDGVELDTSYLTSETVRSDFTITTAVTVEAPAGTDDTNITVRITK